jgi:hypothetical protein
VSDELKYGDLPTCPLPADVREGDVVILRDGQRKTVMHVPKFFAVPLEGYSPGVTRKDGLHAPENPQWQVVAVERDGKIIAGSLTP